MYQDNLLRELIIDNFAGGGGASTAKQIARMGNAVCPPVATALIRANCAEMVVARKVIPTMAMLELEYRKTVERAARRVI